VDPVKRGQLAAETNLGHGQAEEQGTTSGPSDIATTDLMSSVTVYNDQSTDSIQEQSALARHREELMRAYWAMLADVDPRATIEDFLGKNGYCPLCPLGLVGASQKKTIMLPTGLATRNHPYPTGLKGLYFNQHMKLAHPDAWEMMQRGQLPPMGSAIESIATNMTEEQGSTFARFEQGAMEEGLLEEVLQQASEMTVDSLDSFMEALYDQVITQQVTNMHYDM
jgi:hypothetical protein